MVILVRVNLILALILAFMFRALYTLYTGNPYYVDSWPLVAGASTFSSNPEARIFDDVFYDGYNDRWPYSIIEAGLVVLVTGARAEDVCRLLGPTLGALAVLALYTLALRLSDERRASMAALIAACSATLFAFEGGFTKEVYARPLVILAVLAVLYAWRLPLVTLLIMAVTLSHHVSSLALLSILAGITVTALVYELARGVLVVDVGRLLIAIAVTSASLVVHVLLVAPGFWRNAVSLGDIVLAIPFMVASASIAMFALLPSQRVTFKHRLVFSTVIALSALAMSLIAMVTPPTPQTTPLGAYMALYATPLLLSPLFAYATKASGAQAVVAGGWLIGMGAPMAYSAFSGNLAAAAAIQRFINYTLYGVLIAYSTGPGKLVYAQAVLVLLTAPIVSFNILELRDPYYHFNLYSESELTMVRLASAKTPEVYGDSKIHYVAYRYKFLVEPPPLNIGELGKPLVVHRENLAKGFWVEGFIYGGNVGLLRFKFSTVYDDGFNLILR